MSIVPYSRSLYVHLAFRVNIAMLLRVVLLLWCATAVLSRGRTSRVPAQVKEEILATEDADAAYETYWMYYGDSVQVLPSGPPMLMATHQQTGLEEKARKKTNFLKSRAAVKDHNAKFEAGKSRYKLTVNAFSVMDEGEKRRYQGAVNATKSNGTKVDLLGSQNYPSTLSWYKRGYVTDSFDQNFPEKCGSCWTFPAVALLEFALKETTGQLINLSNQELLDCTDDNSCDGGDYTNAWDFVIATQHIATLAEYPYKASKERCQYELYSNALKDNVEITEYKSVPPHSDGLMEAVQLMPLAAAISLEDEFYFYDIGVYEGCKDRHEAPKHAVLITGYGTDYWEIRNSWGLDWGINGFVHFHRGEGTSMCFLLDYATHITFENLRTGSPKIAENVPKVSSPKRSKSSVLLHSAKEEDTTDDRSNNADQCPAECKKDGECGACPAGRVEL